MKNIHIIPTDKPSRLFKDDFGKYFISINIDQEQGHFKPQNIYITSDEEIKEGDYMFDISEMTVYECIGQGVLGYKIILTTDQDLIKDGIQAIDDEFLEWFVAHPSCEEVEVESFVNGNVERIYEIIIPNEEPKQENHICKYCGAETTQSDDECYAKPKQETLEELAESFFNKRAKEEGFENWTQIIVQQEWEFIELFPIEFAKWQAERMYSEEEVEKIARFGFNAGRRFELKAVELDFTFEKWFEQFKKK